MALRLVVIGGIPRSLINFRGPLLRALVAAGHEVVAAAAPAPEDVVAELNVMGVRFCPVPLARAGLNPLGDLKTLFALRALIRREKPDCVLAYTAKPVIYGNFAARGLPGTRVYSMITGLGYGFGAHNLRSASPVNWCKPCIVLRSRIHRACFSRTRMTERSFWVVGCLPLTRP